MRFIKFTYLIVWLSLLSCHNNIYKSNSIAMQPYIHFSDKIIYEINSDKYNYGDVVIYESDNKCNVFRIVGLPGDSIALDKHICIINGIKNKWHETNHNISFYSSIIDNNISEGKEYEEEFPNGCRVKLYLEKNISKDQTPPISSFESIYVPENHYFVLGDTRTLARDSRYIGSISEDKIKGKVVKVIKK